MADLGLAGRLNQTGVKETATPRIGQLGPGPAAGKMGAEPPPRPIKEEGGPYSGEEIRKTKNVSIQDGAFWAVMVGTGESSMSAFALALGAPGGMVGFIQAFPQFFGSLVQLLSLPIAARVKTRRWIVAAGVFLQAAVWIPMAMVALVALPSPIALPAALLFFTLYFATGMLINPMWAAWMAEIVEPNERGKYFAYRNQITTAFLLLSTVLGGLVLLFYDPSHPEVSVFPVLGPAVETMRQAVTSVIHLSLLQAFAGLFLLAFVCRAISAYFLTRMSEKPARETASGHKDGSASVGSVDWPGFLSNPALGEERRFCAYTGALYTATYIAAPFFDVYMLGVLHLDYLTWAVISIAGPLARYVALPYWGRVADRFGNRAVLFVTGLLVPLVPILWLLSKEPSYLFVFQLVSGLAWSGFELASFNYTIAGREPSVRTAQTAAYSFAKGSGYLLGAIIGWAIIVLWPAAGWFGLGAYLGLFAISTLARYAASLYYLPRFSKKTFEGVSSNEFFWQVLLVQPSREVTANMLQLSQSGMNLAAAGANATRRVARRGMDLTSYVLRKGPLLIRPKKDRL